jgi:hypothetical protein
VWCISNPTFHSSIWLGPIESSIPAWRPRLGTYHLSFLPALPLPFFLSFSLRTSIRPFTTHTHSRAGNLNLNLPQSLFTHSRGLPLFTIGIFKRPVTMRFFTALLAGAVIVSTAVALTFNSVPSSATVGVPEVITYGGNGGNVSAFVPCIQTYADSAIACYYQPTQGPF